MNQRLSEQLPKSGNAEISHQDNSFSLGFRQVFDSQSGRVYRTLSGLGVHSSSLEDALQDVFLIVHQKLPSFVPDAQLSTWIYAITYRVAQNYRRRSQRTSHSALSESAICPKKDPESHMARGQAATFVQEFCRGLPEAKRDVFVLCLLEQRSVPEIAEMQGVKLNTIYSRLRLVRAEFCRALENMKEEHLG